MHFNYRVISAAAGLSFMALLPMRGETAVQAPASAPPAADSVEHIYKENVFDPKRAQWSIPAPPAPAIPPPSATDIQLYGVINIGSVKRALFKLSPTLAGFGKRQYVNLTEGQSVGSYQVAEIKSDQVVLSAGEARYPMRFGSKPDRSPAGVPISAPMQSAMELPAAMPTMVPGFTPVVPAAPPIMASAPAVAATPGAPNAPGQPGDAQQPKSAADNPSQQQAAAPISGGTLLEAIEAARRAQAAGNYTPPPNPFAR